MSSQAVRSPLSARLKPKERSRSAATLWVLMAFLATGIAVISSRYFFRPPPASSMEEFPRHFARYLPVLLPHIAGGVSALLLGPWQFLPGLRARHLNFHRWIGRIYLISVLIGGLAGLAMATVSEGGLVAHVGFGLLAALWLATAACAYRTIRRGDVPTHRQWMIRNYSLTFAAVTLRLWFPLFYGPLHIEIMQAYMTVAWLCWVPNLLVAEVLATRLRAAS
jgi:uncharacterized membrane protein